MSKYSEYVSRKKSQTTQWIRQIATTTTLELSVCDLFSNAKAIVSLIARDLEPRDKSAKEHLQAKEVLPNSRSAH